MEGGREREGGREWWRCEGGRKGRQHPQNHPTQDSRNMKYIIITGNITLHNVLPLVYVLFTLLCYLPWFELYVL